MAINLLSIDYQKEFRRERIRRLITVAGAAIFLIVFVNIILLSPLWILFKLQEGEYLRQLSALEKSPAFLRSSSLEREIKMLNNEVARFNAEEQNVFSVSPAIKSVLGRRPSGVGISGISFIAKDPQRGRPAAISLTGSASSRDLLLDFAKSNEEDEFFSKVNSPITNLLKETDVDYSLTLELKQ